MNLQKRTLRIHGDNILECENTLDLIQKSLKLERIDNIGGSAFSPIYKLKSANEEFEVRLFPGYGRWNFNLVERISFLGGDLREAPDAVVTEVKTIDGERVEDPIFAVEFSGALPAGNNAWQRTGRALALAYAGIPYLYFAELGGIELDSNREHKAARFPNPLVPFAYVVLGQTTNTPSLPIYAPSPSANEELNALFQECYSTADAENLVEALILENDFGHIVERIEAKAIKAVEVLVSQRKRNDLLAPEEWEDLYELKTGEKKATWLANKAQGWSKKTGIKTLTKTFRALVGAVKAKLAVSVGSKEMPICLIPAVNRKKFGQALKEIYGGKMSDNFVNKISQTNKNLICVWIAGFKPRGDDSRPDRGLVPLARMIFGKGEVDLLSIVYGPAKEATWKVLEKKPDKLAKTNGLWQSILNLSEFLLVDSNTSMDLKNVGFYLGEKNNGDTKEIILTEASTTPNFGEHDIDSVLHLLFSHNGASRDIYESMCNPPGGDWSGINFYDTKRKTEYRWTSLPRVSGTESKRPDHLIQFLNLNSVLSIESKDTLQKLEDDIGPRLIEYVETLLRSAANSKRSDGHSSWTQHNGETDNGYNYLSGAAFQYTSDENLLSAIEKANVDIVFGVEFNQDQTVVHIHTNETEMVASIVAILVQCSKTLEHILTIRVI